MVNVPVNPVNKRVNERRGSRAIRTGGTAPAARRPGLVGLLAGTSTAARRPRGRCCGIASRRPGGTGLPGLPKGGVADLPRRPGAQGISLASIGGYPLRGARPRATLGGTVGSALVSGPGTAPEGRWPCTRVPPSTPSTCKRS
jgi:hypothetical protein